MEDIHMITSETREKLTDYFWEELKSWDYDSWSSASSADKEDIVKGAILDLVLDPTIEDEEIYDLFWDWAEGVDEDCFGEDED
jgi:hypothetical protein